MKVGDVVQYILYDEQYLGTVLEIYEKEGWNGYAKLLMEENGQRVDFPLSALSMYDEKSQISEQFQGFKKTKIVLDK